MSPTIAAFLGYVIWMLVLLGMMAGVRTQLTLSGNRAANSFAPDGADVSPFVNRLCRAHANCYEGFPIFGGLLLLALATDTTAITDGFAYYFIAARILQSVTHLASSSVLAVQARFAFFLVQFVIAIMWILQFIKL